MNLLAVNCLRRVWAIAGLTAFLVFPLGLGTEYLIYLSPLVLQVSSRQFFFPSKII